MSAARGTASDLQRVPLSAISADFRLCSDFIVATCSASFEAKIYFLSKKNARSCDQARFWLGSQIHIRTAKPVRENVLQLPKRNRFGAFVKIIVQHHLVIIQENGVDKRINQHLHRESISSPLNAVICGFDFSNELKDACQRKTSATTSLSSSMR